MEVILDIKNIPKAMNPTHNDVVVFNGKTWYLTTKQDLLEDAYKLLAEATEELEKFTTIGAIADYMKLMKLR